MFSNLTTRRCKFKSIRLTSGKKIEIHIILLCYLILLDVVAHRKVNGSPLTTHLNNDDYKIHDTSHNKNHLKSDTCHLIPNKDQVESFFF